MKIQGTRLMFLSLICLSYTQGQFIDIASGADGSGLVPTPDENPSTQATLVLPIAAEVEDDTEDDDFTFLPSGDGISSGVEPEPQPESTTLQPNIVCTQLYCWCVNSQGDEVPRTRAYLKKPDCSSYLFTTETTTTQTPTIIPMRSTSPTLPERKTVTVAASTEPSSPDVDEHEIVKATAVDLPPVVEYRTEPTTHQPVILESSTAKPSTKFSNKIPITDVPPVKIDESEEEQTNVIGSSDSISGGEVQREVIGISITHPGILAVVIGGGVVALLCAILLVMFIVYRMRKKDEGSYPLDDGKPSKLQAYTKSSSKEFYA